MKHQLKLALMGALLCLPLMAGCQQSYAADSVGFQKALAMELSAMEPEPTLASVNLTDNERLQKIEKDVAALWNLTNQTLGAIQDFKAEMRSEIDPIKSQLAAAKSSDFDYQTHLDELAKLQADQMAKYESEVESLRSKLTMLTSPKTPATSSTMTTSATGHYETRCVGRRCYQVWVPN